MALIHCDFYSDVLGMASSMYVILPENTDSQIGMKNITGAGKHKTLYLLHGLSDDHTIWLRRTSIERYVSELGLAVVMPAANKSFYTDMTYGDAYWTYISEEIPAKARSFFNLSDKREDNYVAGLSMGGYGAFKMALAKPDCFSAAASLSGAVDITDWIEASGMARERGWTLIFGDLDKVRGSDNDLFRLADKAAASGKPSPRLYQWCGTEDVLYQGNRAFRDYAKKLGLDLTYEESPGDHSWGYWDAKIQTFLDFLNL